jgi:transketolase
VKTEDDLERLAGEMRYIITDCICRAGSGHIGGALSLVEILTVLYERIMNIDPANPDWDGRDRLVISKGHAGPVLYAILARKGYFPSQWLATVNRIGTSLPSHTDCRRTPGVDMTTGSLGQGFSCACGMALAARLSKKNHRVFAIIGDGECDEGQIWEGALFAAHFKLGNLVAICDCNGLQIDGSTEQIMGLEPFADKWRSFGWQVYEVDGHDMPALEALFKSLPEEGDKPVMIVARTVKGKGNREVEGQVASHNVFVTSPEAYCRLIEGLGCTPVALPYE